MQVLLVQSTEASADAAELGRTLSRELAALPELQCRSETVGGTAESVRALLGREPGALARLAGEALELPRHLLRVRNLARDWKPQVVHALSGAAVLAGLLAARAAGAALVVSGDDEEHGWGHKAVRSGLEQLGLAQAWHLAPTRQAAERLAGLPGAAAERIRFVRPGIAAFEGGPPRRRAMRETWCVDDDELLVGTLAELEPGRGLETLLEALARGLDDEAGSGLSPRLALVGSGSHQGALRRTARRLRLGSRVIVGPRPPRIQDAMAAFDLYVQPSERPEAGLACLEAMAAGRAVIASRVDGLDDAVADRVTGLLVTPGNPTLLREAIWRLGLAPDERAEMGRMGRLRVETYFEAGRLAREVARIYGEAARQAAPEPEEGETAR